MIAAMGDIRIRPIRESDSQEFQRLLELLDRETEFMVFEPGERHTTTEDQRKRIRAIESRENQNIFLAFDGGSLIGYVAVIGGAANRNKHRAQIAVGVLSTHRKRGIGTGLFLSMEEWARATGLHRLELTVVTDNKPALRLYKKMGYTIEGVRTHSLTIQDAYVDEYYLAKLL